MKILKRTSFRAVIALFLMVMAGGFLWAGVPALAADLDATAVVSTNSKPIAKILDYSTFKGVAVKGQFSATDPDGDLVTFEITEMPKKGTILPENEGSFVYTPNDGKNGRDSFSYVALIPLATSRKMHSSRFQSINRRQNCPMPTCLVTAPVIRRSFSLKKTF